MSAPYRLIVWGPGGMGKSCIREIALRDDCVLVGVRAFSESKNGVDAGTIAGIDELGVLASTGVDEVLAVDADCVLHTSRDLGDYAANEEILQILRSGKNIITIHPYHHIDLLEKTHCPPGFVDELKQACAEGGSTFHATGIHPEFICHRLTGTLSGLCTDVTSVVVEENWDISFIGLDYAKQLGWAHEPEVAKELMSAVKFPYNYCVQNLHGTARVFGVELERTSAEYFHIPTERDYDLATGGTVKAGTVGRFSHLWKGFVKQDDVNPFITIAVNWMLGPQMLPDGMSPDELYVITLEGRPSLKVGVDIKRSFNTGEYWMVPGDFASPPGYTATAATMFQAIPRVCAAPAGPLEVVEPALRWTPRLEDAEALAGATGSAR